LWYFPNLRIVAPYSAIASAFSWTGFSGSITVQFFPNALAQKAVAIPWLPDETATRFFSFVWETLL
jgi:hypothetical protein